MPPITLINKEVYKEFWKATEEELVIAINGKDIVDSKSEIIRLKNGEAIGNAITVEQIIRVVKGKVFSYDIEGKKPLRVNDVIVYHMHPKGAENFPSIHTDIPTWDEMLKIYPRTYFSIGQMEGPVKKIRLYRRTEPSRIGMKYMKDADYLPSIGIEEISYGLADPHSSRTTSEIKRSFTAAIELLGGNR